MIGFILATISGCVFDTDDGKSEVKKGSVSGTVRMAITSQPLSGIKVYLVNANASIDTVNYAHNRRALVDSAVTDTNGKYSILNIRPGHYGFIPVNGGTAAEYGFGQSAA